MSSTKPVTEPFPVANAVPSYWRKEVGPIDDHRSTGTLPLDADIVVIGAGYAGASIVHHLVEGCVRSGCAIPSIVILEAREACSGATGRNGGHLKPDPLSRAVSVLESYGRDGREVAEHVASFEARQVDAIRDLVHRENIECDFEETRVTDVCLYEAGKEKIKADMAKLNSANISSGKGVEYHLESEAEKVCMTVALSRRIMAFIQQKSQAEFLQASGVRGALSCHTYPAARLWPYRLVSHMLQKAVSLGVNLQTHTPVTSVENACNCWSVHTPRGSVRAKKVVHATNGYTSALVPEMMNKIVPVRGIVARITGRDAPKITDSYMMRFSEYEYDYMIPRPDGSIIVGGAKRDFYMALDEWFHNYDDSRLIKDAESYFDGYMQRHFFGWEDSGAHTEEIWTGIMGYANDGFPYIGPVHGRSGQYLCAGFSGHGMPQIFFCAKAIASMILQGDDTEVDLPLPYRISSKRWSEPMEHVSLKLWQQVAERHSSRAML